MRKSLGIKQDDFVVIGCGLGLFWRKGADLFIEAARLLKSAGIHDFHFYWIGKFDPFESHDKFGYWGDVVKRIDTYDLKDYVTFLGLKEKPEDYYMSGDVFILPSREDPFPLVCLEAAACGLPVICFADAGGMPDFVEDDAGFVVPYEDVNEMSEKIQFLMQNTKVYKRMGKRAHEKINKRYTVAIAVPEILKTCRVIGQFNPAVSVIVPNYNYGRYLEKRLNSVINQTFKDFELIIIDDASTDNSLDIISKYTHRPEVTLITSENNSGSVFKQWFKGIGLAKSEIIWIAEADDYSDLSFLETLLPFMNEKDVHLSFCASHAIDEKDNITKNFYFEVGYFNNLPNKNKWNKDYISTGNQELNDGLIIKNTIPNASAVLMRKSEIIKINTDDLFNYKCGGDWFIYINIIRNGKIAYTAQNLNYHRRHNISVVGKSSQLPEDTVPDYYKIHKFTIENFEISENVLKGMINSVTKDLRNLWPDVSNNTFKDLYNKNSLIDLYSARAKNNKKSDETTS